MFSFIRRAVNWMFSRRVMHLDRATAFATVGTGLAYHSKQNRNQSVVSKSAT